MADRFEPSPPTARPFLEFRPLLRAVGIASDGKKLILATLGLLALSAGWSLIARGFGQPSPWFSPIPPGSERDALSTLVETGSPAQLALLILEPFKTVVGPFASLFARKTGPGVWFQTALMALWAVGVWGIVGGSIARIAVVQAAGDQRVGLLSAVKFALSKWLSLIGAPLTPLFGVAIFAAFGAVFGLLYRIPWGIGTTLTAIFGFVPLLLGLVMALILVGLALGWPLMHATVAAEGEDAPDALSRSYSYVNQRPARYAVHTLASALIGTIGLALVISFAGLVLALAMWSVELGAGSSIDLYDRGRLFWRGIVGLLVHAWIYSYFWSSTPIIYLILRRDVDGTAWNDVYLPEHDADTFAGDPDRKAPAQVKEIEAR